MNLYNYLENISINNFIDANGLFLCKELLSKQELDDFCEKNSFRPLTIGEFQSYIEKKEKNFIELLKELKLNPYQRYKIYNYNSEFSFYIIRNSFMRSQDDPNIEKGIVVLKSIPKEKTFKKIEDLKLPNLGLSVTISRGDIIKIICYDKNVLNDRYDDKSNFIHPILFYGKIKNDGKDITGTQISYGASMVAVSVARDDVSGRDILYPIMAYYSDKKLLISDRGSVSDSAYKVWDKLHQNKGKFKVKGPIDNTFDPITPQKEDDGKIYNDGKNYKHEGEISNSEILNDPNLSQTQKEKHLIELREKDPLNWVYSLNSSEINKIKNITNYLEKNDNDFKIDSTKLISLAEDLFIKRSF